MKLAVHVTNNCIDSSIEQFKLYKFEHNKTTKYCSWNNGQRRIINTTGRNLRCHPTLSHKSYVDIATTAAAFMADGDPGPASPTDKDAT